MDRIFLSYLNVYCDPGSLVLVLNTNSADEVGTAACLRFVLFTINHLIFTDLLFLWN